jgi:MarR family transcriptional regulator, organic hydroperoxide resistance regulator
MPMQDRDRPLPEQIHRLLIELFGRIKDGEQSCLERFGVTRVQGRALYRIDPGETVAIGALAERMYADPSNVTPVLAQLEERGLVERGQATHDRRVRVVALTEEGAALRARLVECTFGEYPAAAALSEAERRQLRDLLARLVDAR